MKNLFLHPRALTALLLFGLNSTATPLTAEEVKAEEAPAEKLKLPGIEINVEEGFVDVDAQISLTDGLLELVACTKGTKEHEAVVCIQALPLHVHTALLLVGARNGTPAMRKPINEEQTRWMHIMPSGDPIKVSLVVEDAEGKKVERPISDFIRRTEGDPYMPDLGYQEEETTDEEKPAFPDTFTFTGSHLITNDDGSRQYLADQSGHVITISTFGDEMLGLAEIQSRENGELVWEIHTENIPPLDSAVKMRLRPQTKE